MIETLFRALVIFQPLIWIWVLEDDRFEFLNKEIYFEDFEFASLLVFYVVLMSGFEIGFYSTEILIVYILMAWGLCNRFMKLPDHGFRVSLALSFLLVYVNSWYWEGILHVWAINENGLNMNQLFQLLHLAPVPYLLYRWGFEVDKSLNWLLRGFIFSTGIAYLKFFRAWQYIPMVHSELSVYWINHGLMIANRIFCLYCLYSIFVSHAFYKKIE